MPAPREDPEAAAFRVGGIDRQLTEEEQLEQLGSYIDAHYPHPSFAPPWAGGTTSPAEADNWCARLPDRLTHAAMLMLGSALDHAMPGVAFSSGVSVEPFAEVDGATVLRPHAPSGRWAISLHGGGWWRGSGAALEHQWRPEVAAAAALSGTTIVDVDYPLAPRHTVADMMAAVAGALEATRARGATSVALWGASSGAALATLCSGCGVCGVGGGQADALLLTYPRLDTFAQLPEDLRRAASGPADLLELPDPSRWPATLVQVARHDDTAPQLPDLRGDGIEVREYVARHWISTPAVARERISDAAEFLRHVAASS